MTSTVRTRAFWASVLLGPGAASPGPDDPLDGRATTTVSIGRFQVAVDRYEVVLTFDDDRRSQRIAWLDDAHPTPHLLRWNEVVAVATHFENRPLAPYPTGPSLILLLLSPFVVVTSHDDLDAIERLFRSEVTGLGLLTADEIDRAATRMMSTAATELEGRPTFVPLSWERDEHVGWKLRGGIPQHSATRESWLGIYSARQAGRGFPAAAFIDYLRSFGVDDV